MAVYPTLNCSLRPNLGSNAARKLRQQGLLPASVYGHGDPVSLTARQHDYSVIAHASHSGSQLVNLIIEGQDGGLVLVKSVLRDPIKQTLMHLELQRVSLQEELQATVAVVLTGEPLGVKEGGMLETQMHALHLRCAASLVPDNVTYDISAMQIGDTLKAGAFELPTGCTLIDRPEECVALIRAPIRVAATEATEETTTA